MFADLAGEAGGACMIERVEWLRRYCITRNRGLTRLTPLGGEVRDWSIGKPCI